MFNSALKLVVAAEDSEFESEKMTTATYSGCEENTQILEQASKRYTEATGLKASTRRLYNFAIRLYLDKFTPNK